MATLNSADLAEIRNKFQAGSWNKLQVNAALQAIEDWWDANAASLNSAINTATSPFTFSVSEKKEIVKYWLLGKFNRGG